MLLELDSSYVCHMIVQSVVDSHVRTPLVNAVRILMEQFNGNVVVRHIYREANACADGLAKHGHSLPLGVVFFERVPSCIFLEFLVELSRLARLRIMNM